MSGDSWDDYADGWDDDPAARDYSRAAYASLVDDLARRGRSLDHMRVLDFGCGTGLLTEQLVDQVGAVHAVDTSQKMLAALGAKAERLGWSNVTASATVPDDATWDLIACSSVCSFLEDYPGTVVQLVSGLSPGGIFIQWDWEAASPNDEHGLTRAQINEALAGAGLADIDVRVAFSVPFEDQHMEPLAGSGVRP